MSNMIILNLHLLGHQFRIKMFESMLFFQIKYLYIIKREVYSVSHGYAPRREILKKKHKKIT